MVELIWDGKYDADGKRTAPLRVALPFQTVETVNESAQQRQMTLDLFSMGRPTEWRNRLIWGDKKYVLPSLLPEFAGQVDLIYIDPPFATGADFSFKAKVGDESFTKEPSMIETKAYRDTWGRGLDGYLAWFYETIVILHELLAETGNIFVHVGWQVSSAARILLDEVFGRDNHLNEIIWKRTPHAGSSKARSKKFPINHECIYWYSKGTRYTYYAQYIPYDEKYIKRFTNPDDDPRGPWQSVSLRTYSEETFERMKKEDKLIPPQRKGAGWRYKWFLSETKGKQLEDIWSDVGALNSMAEERTDYATQKPEALLERIIQASSNEGDLILDCFSGSGTTAAVAEKLGRRWIACDLGRFAIHTTRKRLLGIDNVRPFVVQNLGKYERQVWQKAEFGTQAAATIRRYRRFILDLYHADFIEGYVWLHGKKGGRMVHVGAVDSPVALGDVRQAALEFHRAVGSGDDAPREAGVDMLGWDFALDMNETARQIAQEAGVSVRFVRIPREVLEKKAVEQGDIRFFELAALSVDVHVTGRSVKIELTDFMVPPDDVPADVMKAVRKWSEWIDYWAVDFNYRDDTFHNEWQSYRTRKDRSLQLSIVHEYEQPGVYTLMVKVIDILGNDTTRAVEVEIN